MVFQVPVGFEPTIRELQSHALPLGYGTIFSFEADCLASFEADSLASCLADSYKHLRAMYPVRRIAMST